MKLHGLARAHVVCQRDRPAFLIYADDVSDQEIAPAKLLAVFADGATDQQPVLQQLLLVVAHRGNDIPQRLHRGTAAKLLDDVIMRFGDDERLADRPAALADDGLDFDGAAETDADEAFVEGFIVAHQHVHPGVAPAAGHPADERQARRRRFQRGQKWIERRGERIAKPDQRPRFLPDTQPVLQLGGIFNRLAPRRPTGDMKWMHAHARKRPGQHRDPRKLLDFPHIADHALGTATDGALRIELQPDPLDNPRRRVAVVLGEKHKRDIDISRRLAHLPDRLLDGTVRVLLVTGARMKSQRQTPLRPFLRGAEHLSMANSRAARDCELTDVMLDNLVVSRYAVNHLRCVFHAKGYGFTK